MKELPSVSGDCVLITGASRGLGAALAVEYAEAGAVLALTGRDEAALAGVAARCRELGATVVTGVVDLSDHARLAAWVAEVDGRYPIALLIANAGIFEGRRESEPHEALERAITVLRTNLETAIASVDAVLPAMRRRGRGQIALISSLAAVHPLADAPAYSASKAGLAAYGEALAEAVAEAGIGVSVVLAGHIATRQARMQVGALPMLMPAAAAARLIRRRLTRRSGRIAFPRALLLLVRLNAVLPRRLRHALGRSFRFHVLDLSDIREDRSA
jgi:short-subunit dehydrogenase